MTELSFVTPELIGSWVILGSLATGLFWKMKTVGKILRSYAQWHVSTAKVMADGKWTIDEPSMPEYIEKSMEFQQELEDAGRRIFGYTLNHFSTGWPKGYLPSETDIRKGIDGAIHQLADITDEQVEASAKVEQPTEQLASQVVASA